LMAKIPDAVTDGGDPRHVMNISVPGTDSESMLMALDLRVSRVRRAPPAEREHRSVTCSRRVAPRLAVSSVRSASAHEHGAHVARVANIPARIAKARRLSGQMILSGNGYDAGARGYVRRWTRPWRRRCSSTRIRRRRRGDEAHVPAVTPDRRAQPHSVNDARRVAINRIRIVLNLRRRRSAACRERPFTNTARSPIPCVVATRSRSSRSRVEGRRDEASLVSTGLHG
jgi:hypothetical protein